MKIPFHAGAVLALLAVLAAGARAESRMQVSAGSTSIRAQPAADAPAIGQATSGEILFVVRVEGDWAAISPPDRIDLWLNKDFIEGNRVVAKSIQLRAGPGVQYPVVGVLERGSPVMPRGEDGDWCRIAAPSAAVLWVKKSDLSDVRAASAPIQQVAPVPEPAQPAPAPVVAAPPPASKPEPAPQPEPGAHPVEVAVAAPAPAPPPPPAPQPVPRIAPSKPHAAAPSAASAATPAPPAAPHAAAAVPPPKPAPVATARPAAAPRPPTAPVLHPATALPAQTQPTATAAKPAPAKRVPAQVAAAQVAPSAPKAPAAAAKPDSRRTEVEVDPGLVDDLDLEDLPNQGKTVQVEGELRNAPFMAGSPSRYRLQARDEDGVLEMICHVHGDSAQLRPFIGKTISIRGREYWVEDSDMPVVVVGQIESLEPVADEDEPVMF